MPNFLSSSLFRISQISQLRTHSAMASTSTFEDGAWHGLIGSDGQFPPQKGRYHLYIGLPNLHDIQKSTNWSARAILSICPPCEPHSTSQRPDRHYRHLDRKAIPKRRWQRLARMEISYCRRPVRRFDSRPTVCKQVPARGIFQGQERLRREIQCASLMGQADQ